MLVFPKGFDNEQVSPFPQDNARIGLPGVAFDENSSYTRGPALAPQGIREAFFCDSSDLWTENETHLGADVVGLNPARDPRNITGKIFKELVARMLQ